jgi:hypothetical protein
MWRNGIMSSPYKLRLAEEPPYSPAVPEPLAEAPPPPPPPPDIQVLPTAQPEFREAEEFDIAEAINEQQRADSADESVLGAIGAGLVAAIVCIIVAGGFAALSHYWHCSFSVGIAFVVACAVKHFGRGNDARFGFIGSGCAMVACVGAYHLAWAFVLASHEQMSLLEYVASVENWSQWASHILGWFDLLCYAIAAVCGYKFSYDAVADKY